MGSLGGIAPFCVTVEDWKKSVSATVEGRVPKSMVVLAPTVVGWRESLQFRAGDRQWLATGSIHKSNAKQQVRNAPPGRCGHTSRPLVPQLRT